jgi:hypothetical protein
MDDLTNLRAFAKVLQTHIVGKANAVLDKLTLMDLKMKEEKIIEEEIKGVKAHPGNISSNLGNNLQWKERLDEIVNNAASVHTEFDTALYGVCEVIKRINFFVKNMERTYTNPSSIKQPSPDTQYYPNEYTIMPNEQTLTSLGPKAGHYNPHNPLMNGDLGFPNGKHRENTQPNFDRKALIRDIAQDMIPSLKKSIQKEVETALNKKISKENPETVLQKITKEESDIERVPSAEPAVLRSIKNNINKIAKKIAKNTTVKILKLPEVKKAQKVAHKAGKDSSKVEKALHKAQATVAKKLPTIQKQVAKKIINVAQKILNKPVAGKALVKGIVKHSAPKAVSKTHSNPVAKHITETLKNNLLNIKVADKAKVNKPKVEKIAEKLVKQSHHQIKSAKIPLKFAKNLSPTAHSTTQKVAVPVGKIRAPVSVRTIKADSKKILKENKKAVLKAKAASHKANVIAVKAKKVASKQPNNPVVKQAAKVAVQNAKQAAKDLKAAKKDLKEAKKQLKEIEPLTHPKKEHDKKSSNAYAVHTVRHIESKINHDFKPQIKLV